MNSDLKIPSVISYSPNSNDEQQWGKSLSPESVAMINTKLELDAQDNKTDELELILAVLEGMSNLNFQHVRASKGYPEYTWKSPEEIVTDFLSKIYQVVDREVNQFSTELRAQLPVDIVITVPVVSLYIFQKHEHTMTIAQGWSYQAKNSTLRAVRTAGFNEKNFPNLQDTIMVTEPEAAAIYTARYLKSLKGEDVLKVFLCPKAIQFLH
jgi:molecular chaperone DnaK (HSP70)